MSGNKADLVQTTIKKAADDAGDMLKQIGLAPEAFARVALNAALTNPDILNCDIRSLRKAILLCAQRGIMPDGESAALVPFNGKAQLIMGYKGMCDLARRAIKGLVIRANVVTKDDEWEHEEGLTEILRHVPLRGENRPTEKNVIAAYALARIPGNPAPEFVVLYKPELDYIRKTYTSAKSKAWAEEYAEQAKKTALRRLLKTLPIRSGLMAQMEAQLADPNDQPLDDIIPGDVVADPEPPAGEPEPHDSEQPEQPAATHQRPVARPRRGGAPKPAAPKPAAPEPDPEPPAQECKHDNVKAGACTDCGEVIFDF